MVLQWLDEDVNTQSNFNVESSTLVHYQDRPGVSNDGESVDAAATHLLNTYHVYALHQFCYVMQIIKGGSTQIEWFLHQLFELVNLREEDDEYSQ